MSVSLYCHKIEEKRSPCQRRPTTRCGHIAVAVDRFLLVWGGYWLDKEDGYFDQEKYLPGDEIWIFDTDTETWFVRESSNDFTPTGRAGATAVVVDLKLYLFGGFTLDLNLNDLHTLDLNTLTWTYIKYSSDFSKLPSPRDKHTMWAYKNKLYIFGGYGPSIHPYLCDNGKFEQDNETTYYGVSVRGWNNQLLVYDLSTGVWENPSGRGDIPNPRAAMATATMGTCVYLFGGRHINMRMNDLHCLDMETMTWSGRICIDGSVPVGRTWHSLTPLSSTQLFLYGGFTQDKTALSEAWILDTSNNSFEWKQLDVPTTNYRLWHTACQADSGDLLVFGGCCNNILDHDVRPIKPDHASEMLHFRFSPKSLVKICLEAVFSHRVLMDDWLQLPKSLSDNLSTRVRSLQENSEEDNTDEDNYPEDTHNGNRVCILS